tara:strand:- start:438 stop:1814 length:1377 start_codon:yes stop_codon:yes gene_type:complete
MKKNIEIVNNPMSPQEPSMAISANMKIMNYPVSLINSVRRTLLSDIPNVVFKKVTINNNKTNAHNEFIKHRITLLPIFRNEYFKLISLWDSSLQKRIYRFTDDLIIPKFIINKKKKHSQVYNDSTIENITSNDFDIKINDIDLKCNDYFKKDLWTGDYIKIMILKNQEEHLQLESIPEISFGRVHSGFSPIGSVSYSYEKESNITIENIKQQKFLQINRERKNKNLVEFKLNSQEHKEFNESFDLLDSDRIYVKNKQGECNLINMEIESIGVIEPLQAMMDAITVLQLTVQDYQKYHIYQNKINSSKIEFHKVSDELATLIFYDETHTIGNLLTDYLRKLNSHFGKKIIIFNNYKLVHPLEQILQFTIKIDSTIIKEVITDEITTSKLIFGFLITTAFQLIEKDIGSFIRDFKEAQKTKVSNKINKPSFEIINLSQDVMHDTKSLDNKQQFEEDDVFF